MNQTTINLNSKVTGVNFYLEDINNLKKFRLIKLNKYKTRPVQKPSTSTF